MKTKSMFRSDIEYLAIPYSDKSESVMDYRAEVSDLICAEFMNQGRIIFAPISSCHHIAKRYSLPRTWDFWQHLDEEFVKICKSVIVVMLDGWDKSTGVKAEIELADKYGIPVKYLDPKPYLKRLKKKRNE